VGVSFAAASRRLGRAGLPVLALAGAAMVISGVLVAAEYQYVSFRYGGAPVWTDAIFNLRDYMKGLAPPGNIYTVDWGTFDSLRLLSKGTLRLAVGDDPISKPELKPEDRPPVIRMVSDPGAVFIAHTKDYENFHDVNAKLLKFADSIGYQRVMLSVVSDSYGRPAYEVYRFQCRDDCTAEAQQ
jgi:hypothetical protein